TARVVRDEDGTRRTVEWTTRYGQTARRRGINVDPLGTGWRLLERAAGERPPGERPPGVPAPEGRAAGREDTVRVPDPDPPRSQVPITDGAPHASFRRALAHLGPRPPARHDRAEHHRRAARDRKSTRLTPVTCPTRRSSDLPPGERPPGVPAPEGRAAGREDTVRVPDPDPPRSQVPITDGAPHASFRRALAHLGPRPPARHDRAEHHRRAARRRDYVFLPRLTVISDVPWRGIEPGAG